MHCVDDKFYLLTKGVFNMEKLNYLDTFLEGLGNLTEVNKLLNILHSYYDLRGC